MATSPIQSAPNLRVLINGKVVGYASGLNYNVVQGQKPFFTVDSPFPAEIGQGAAPSIVNGQFNLFMLRGRSLDSLGITGARTEDNGKSGDFKTTTLGAAKYSVIEIFDRTTNSPILRITYAMFSSAYWNVMIKDVVQGQVSFQGILVSQGEDQINNSFF